MKYLNKIYQLFLILLILLVIPGCSLKKEQPSGAGNYIDPIVATKIVIEGIQNKDIESIHEIFCPYVKENDRELDKKIEDMFEFIEGNIVSFDEVGQDVSGSLTDTKGDRWDAESGIARTVKTDKNKDYKIKVCIVKEYENNASQIGVNGIVIIDKKRFDKEKSSYPDDAIYRLEYEETE